MADRSSLASAPDDEKTIYATTDAFLDSVGVCGHFARTRGVYAEKFENILPEVIALGVRHLRDDGIIGPRHHRDSPSFRRFRRLVAQGVRLNLICYDQLNPYLSTPLDKLADLHEWCGGGIELFEGSNEPVLTKSIETAPRLSAQHQIDLARTIRATPEISTIPLCAPSYVLKNRQYAENLHDVCDYGNIHPYAGMEHPETSGPGSLARSRAASTRISGDNQFIASEIGYHTSIATKKFHFPVSEGIKARYLTRALLWCFASGIRRSYIYELVSSFGRDDSNPESSFGLLRHDISRTPAFDAVRALLSLCASPTRALAKPGHALSVKFVGTDPERMSLQLARPDGALLVPVWLAISGWRWPAKIETPPQERALSFTVRGHHSGVAVHRFRDDGSVDRGASPHDGNYNISVSDQLTVIVIQ